LSYQARERFSLDSAFVGRFSSLFLAVVLVAVCQTTAQPVPTRVRALHLNTAVADAVCSRATSRAASTCVAGSGPINGYITNLQTSSPRWRAASPTNGSSLRTLRPASSAIALFTSRLRMHRGASLPVSKAKSRSRVRGDVW